MTEIVRKIHVVEVTLTEMLTYEIELEGDAYENSDVAEVEARRRFDAFENPARTETEVKVAWVFAKPAPPQRNDGADDGS